MFRHPIASLLATLVVDEVHQVFLDPPDVETKVGFSSDEIQNCPLSVLASREDLTVSRTGQRVVPRCVVEVEYRIAADLVDAAFDLHEVSELSDERLD